MAIKYPSITPASTADSPSQHHLATKLPTTSGDFTFDTYTLDYSDDRQMAYAVVIIQNTTVQSTASVMNVSSIALSQIALDNGFSLDPVDASSNLEMGASVTVNGITGAPLAGGNRIRTVASVSNFAAATVDPAGQDKAFDTATHCLLLPPLTQAGGTAHGGVNAQAASTPDITLTNLSSTAADAALGTFRVLPLYKTTQITAGNGATNPLNQNDYAAFVLRYAPAGALDESNISLSTLTITTSAGTEVIGLSYSAQNVFAPTYQWGLGSHYTDGVTSFSIADPQSKSNGNTLDMGMWPVGTSVAPTNGTSSNPTFGYALSVRDGSPQTDNGITVNPNIADTFATNLDGATAFNFAQYLLFYDYSQDDNRTIFIHENGPTAFNFVFGDEVLDNEKWLANFSPDVTSVLNGTQSSQQLMGLSVAPMEYTEAEAKMAAKVNIQYILPVANGEVESLTHQFTTTFGFYYPLSIKNTGSEITNDSGDVNYRRRALRTTSIGVGGAVNQATMYSGDKFNLKLIFDFQNYSGSAFATASINFSNDFVFVPGTYTLPGDVYAINYNANSTSIGTVSTSTATVWDTSAIINEKQSFVLEVPVQAKKIEINEIYSNFNQYVTNIQQSTAFMQRITGAYETNPSTDELGGKNNDGSYSASVKVSGDQTDFTSKLGSGHEKNWYVDYFPIEPRVRMFVKDTVFNDQQTRTNGTSFNIAFSNYTNWQAPTDYYYTPWNNIGALETALVKEDGQSTLEDATFYKVGTATTVANTAAAFHTVISSSVNSTIDQAVGTDLTDVYFSGANGASLQNVFNNLALVYRTNPSLSNANAATNSLTSRFAPVNKIIVKPAIYNSSDQFWYADVDIKFDNVGEYETLAYKATIEPSNIVSTSGAPVKPANSNAPLYSVVVGTKHSVSTPHATSSSAHYTTNTNTATANSITQIFPSGGVDTTGIHNAAWCSIPPQPAVVGNEFPGSYAQSNATGNFVGGGPAADKLTVGAKTRLRFKQANNSSAAGDYYAMVTIETIDNTFANNMKYNATTSTWEGSTVGDSTFKVSIHRYIVKFVVAPNANLAITDADTNENLASGTAIDFGNITVG